MEEEKQQLKDEVQGGSEAEAKQSVAPPQKDVGGGGGWGGWGFSPLSVFSDLQKAAEEISRNAAAAAQTAAKSLAEMQDAGEESESSKEEEGAEESEAKGESEESEDESAKIRKSALDKLEKASEDSIFSQAIDLISFSFLVLLSMLWFKYSYLQSLKAIDSSMENLASGAWQAFGSALKGGTTLVNKLEHSAANLAESIQQGGPVAPSILETGKAFTSKGIQVLELVGKETMDLLISEAGIDVEKNSKGADRKADDNQLFEEVTFDRCFYIYGGPEQLEELGALSSHYALLFNRRKGKLSSEQKSVYDEKLKEVQEIFSLGTEMDGSFAELDKGKKKETGADGSSDEIKDLHDSSVSKAADMAAGRTCGTTVVEITRAKIMFTSALSGQAVNDIIQRTTGRVESLHSEGVHRLSEMCCSAVSQLLMLGKSIITGANKIQEGSDDAEEMQNTDWPEDSVEKAKLIRSKAQSMTGYLEAVSNSFITGISDVADAYVEAMKGVSAESHEALPPTSLQEKANACTEHLRTDRTTAVGKIQDGLQYLTYVVVSTSMPVA
ncbi:hypothetical protein G4B88_030712 [Cannabis sativa]|uniref:DUF7798 domain-containing protein n=1 Tax=Cannabis sativa TaxID=3483 RepID=A0A7J6H9E6_CANSA|nr:hypothetical protein G4B88_030712 [Cannabis sativa]